MPDDTEIVDTGPNEPDAGPTEPEAAFSEPWHAQLFAVTHSLASGGRFDWPDWADHFAAALKHADESGAPKDGSAYYEIWLTAFEEFLINRGLADTDGLSSFKRDWTEAYVSTPHGDPVELNR